MSRGGIAIGGGLGEDPSSGTQTSRSTNPQEEELKQFSATVLASTEDVWTDIFRQEGESYRKPTLVLFTDQVRSGYRHRQRSGRPFLLSWGSEALSGFIFL